MPRQVSLSFDLLRTFLALVHHQGNAAKSAKELDINQPSMSKRLGFLQHAGPVLERPWLFREGKTWRLTEEGTKILPAVEELVRRYEQLQQFVTQPPRVVHVGGHHPHLWSAVRTFRASHSEVRLRVLPATDRQLIGMVANGSLDFVVVQQDDAVIKAVARRTLHSTELPVDPLVVVAIPHGQPWAAEFLDLKTGKVKPKDLAELPLLLPENDLDWRKGFDAAVRADEVEPTVALEVDVAQLPALVADGCGIALLPESVAMTIAGAEVRALNNKQFPSLPTRLLARPGLVDAPDLSPDAKAFYDAVRATWGQAQ
jgi:DNA-binding transcriptional LysR family regulator